MEETPLTLEERETFLALFVRAGNVLNFSNDKFDAFSTQSIGFSPRRKYGLSKGKSLSNFVYEGDNGLVIKLLSDLLKYYENHYQNEIRENNDEVMAYSDIDYADLYEKCRKAIALHKGKSLFIEAQEESVVSRFDSEYLNKQFSELAELCPNNPAEAIGRSKELIESCCKTILENIGRGYDKNWSVSKITKETMKALKVAAEDINEGTPAGEQIRAILGNLHGIASNVAMLRNTYGTGHGRSDSFSGLSERHAKLAVGASLTLAEYLWDAFEWRERSGNLG